MASKRELAGIEYHGIAGVSKECQIAVMRLLQFGDKLVKTRIITHENKHCLLLTNSIGDQIAIKSGFTSGYGGEGPRRFSYTLHLLETHAVEIDECLVDEPLFERLEYSGLTLEDLKYIENAKPVRPSRWYDYLIEYEKFFENKNALWREFAPTIPYAIIDIRLADLVIDFWKEPDARLMRGYRRLEDIIRKRTGLRENNTKLFSTAFREGEYLDWDGIDEAEKIGRVNLFTGAFMAHRNPRAHKELDENREQHLSELLLLNHLYRLEREAVLAAKSK